MTMGPEAQQITSDDLIPVVTLILEDLDTLVLGMSADHPQPTQLLNECRALIAANSLRPDDVALVISGNFVESVRARLPEGPYRDAYDEQRGAGTVGGKTMKVGDEIHVVMHAWMFADAAAAEAHGWDPDLVTQLRETADARTKQVRRTAVHEAQHVAMEQADETDVTLDGLSWRRQNFLTVAHQVIEEYRAELAVPVELRETYETELPVDSLTALRGDLRRIATVEYQQHVDVARLAHDATQQSHHLWKALAYVAAARRVYGEPIASSVPAEVSDDEDWQLMAEPHWTEFEELLSRVPAGDTRITPRALEDLINELAEFFVSWLRTFGFRWTDTRFDIESWDILI